MEECKKCGGRYISVVFQPKGSEQTYKRLIENINQFMRDDTYYHYDKVKEEHLIYTCNTCNYQIAELPKDKK